MYYGEPHDGVRQGEEFPRDVREAADQLWRKIEIFYKEEKKEKKEKKSEALRTAVVGYLLGLLNDGSITDDIYDYLVADLARDSLVIDMLQDAKRMQETGISNYSDFLRIKKISILEKKHTS